MARGNTPNEDREFLAFHDRNAAEAIALAGKRALIVGGGATGSNVAALLGKAGMDLIVIDGDDLEVANLHRHIAPKRLIGQNKAEAVAKTLKAELPRAQKVWAVKRPLEFIDRERRRRIVANVDVVIAATGNDAADRWLNNVCRREGILFVVPSLWPDTEPVLGDVLVVPWQRRPRQWRLGCFECLRPSQDGAAQPGLVAQRGLGVDVVLVANFTAQLVIALLLPDSQRGRWLNRELGRGRNYFLIPRLSPRLRPVETTRRGGCPGCEAPNTPPAPKRFNWRAWEDWKRLPWLRIGWVALQVIGIVMVAVTAIYAFLVILAVFAVLFISALAFAALTEGS